MKQKTVKRQKQKTGMEWLRERMELLGYTSLEQVANDIGINRGNLYRYFSLETRPSVAMIRPMCFTLDCGTDELLKALKV